MANLADLTVADIEAAIGDAELEGQRQHGIPVGVRVSMMTREGRFIMELAASTCSSCVERTVVSDETWFSTRGQVDNYLGALLSMIVRSAVEQMDMAACRA